MGKRKSSNSALTITALAILVALLLAWHLWFPLLGAAVAISAVSWAIMVGTIILICAVILLFFIFSGIGMVFLAVLSGIWTIVAIILAPILFPLLLPLLITLMCISYFRRRRADND